MATSMVKGNPVKLMLSFAFPLLIGNLLQQTYNIIDAAIVGQTLGPEALASVGASSSVQFLVLGFCMGSCTGFSVPVAKYFGAGKLDKMRDYIFNGAAPVSYTHLDVYKRQASIRITQLLLPSADMNTPSKFCYHPPSPPTHGSMWFP